MARAECLGSLIPTGWVLADSSGSLCRDVVLSHVPFVEFLAFGLGSYRHKIWYPDEGAWYEPKGSCK